MASYASDPTVISKTQRQILMNFAKNTRKLIRLYTKAEHSSQSILRLLVALTCSVLLPIVPSCGFSNKPSKVVTNLARALERGEIDQASGFFSRTVVERNGIGPLKENLAQTTAELKEHGGVKSIKVLSEDEAGDLAEVVVEIERGNGIVTKARYKLVREQGAWKINDVSLDVAGLVNEPLQPGSAVGDVVKWAHHSGAVSLKDWLKQQSVPPICTASPVDRNTLPDEVRYHDVDDPKVKERLVNALRPVLILVGCPSSQGIVLYSGAEIYAANLGGGQIAITPGASYLTGTPPDENIFHSLAELRIFFAREVFRPLVPIEKASDGLTEADMLVRQDLKLNYLAGLVSLTIDKDPAILDRVALDISTYSNPIGIVSGMQGTPSLQQIQDVLGATKSDQLKK